MVYRKAGGSSQGIRPNLNLSRVVNAKPINITQYKTLVLSYGAAINKVSDIQVTDEPWEEWNKVYKMLYPETIDVVQDSYIHLNGYFIPFTDGKKVVENWNLIDSDKHKLSFGGEYDYEKVSSGGSIQFTPKMSTGKYIKAEKVIVKFVLPFNTGPRIRQIYVEF